MSGESPVQSTALCRARPLGPWLPLTASLPAVRTAPSPALARPWKLIRRVCMPAFLGRSLGTGLILPSPGPPAGMARGLLRSQTSSIWLLVVFRLPTNVPSCLMFRWSFYPWGVCVFTPLGNAIYSPHGHPHPQRALGFLGTSAYPVAMEWPPPVGAWVPCVSWGHYRDQCTPTTVGWLHI